MKYIVEESRMLSAMSKGFDDIFEISKIVSENSTYFDAETETFEEEENAKVFYIDGNYDDNVCFRWYSCDYFEKESFAQTICPSVTIEDDYIKILNGYFGRLWKEPFKIWFESNFGLPVKTIEAWLE